MVVVFVPDIACDGIMPSADPVGKCCDAYGLAAHAIAGFCDICRSARMRLTWDAGLRAVGGFDADVRVGGGGSLGVRVYSCIAYQRPCVRIAVLRVGVHPCELHAAAIGGI